MTRESDILYERGDFFVLDMRLVYAVCRNGHTHATVDSQYDHTPDGLSLAKARAAYLSGLRGKVCLV